jgi:hypothetical protein
VHFLSAQALEDAAASGSSSSSDQQQREEELMRAVTDAVARGEGPPRSSSSFYAVDAPLPHVRGEPPTPLEVLLGQRPPVL